MKVWEGRKFSLKDYQMLKHCTVVCNMTQDSALNSHSRNDFSFCHNSHEVNSSITSCVPFGPCREGGETLFKWSAGSSYDADLFQLMTSG